MAAWGDGSLRRVFRPVAVLLLALLPLVGIAQDEIATQVRIEGEGVWVDVSFGVAATRAQVWDVLTDFDHMAGFISNLAASRVISREGAILQVSQNGAARRGVLSFPFEVLREIRLQPMNRIESHLLQGSMKKQEGLTELSGDGAETRVVFHGESVPGVWMPPLVTKGFIEKELREQFEELRGEILRRRGATGGSPKGGPG